MTTGGWISVAYISTVPMTVAYLAWFRGLRMVPASTAATTVLMSPVVGVIGSGVLLGETFGPRQIVALVMALSRCGARGPRIGYSCIVSPEPPNSDGKSFSLGRPSRIGSTVSW